jgi:septum site-determining protein MinC
VTAAARPRQPIRFRGRSFLALVLAPEAPLADWLARLDGWLERSPAFFSGRAVVLDLSGLGPDKSEVAALIADLNTRGIRVMAVEGSTTACSAGPSAGDQWRARIRRARRDRREESRAGRQEGRAALAPDRGADPLGPVHRLSARRRRRHRLGRLRGRDRRRRLDP